MNSKSVSVRGEAQENVFAISEILEIANALSHRVRLGIIVELFTGEKSFTQLVDDFHLGPSTINSHLRTLENAKLVENFWQKGTDYHSFYRLTPRAEKLLEMLGITPEKVKEYKEHYGNSKT